MTRPDANRRVCGHGSPYLHSNHLQRTSNWPYNKQFSHIFERVAVLSSLAAFTTPATYVMLLQLRRIARTSLSAAHSNSQRCFAHSGMLRVGLYTLPSDVLSAVGMDAAEYPAVGRPRWCALSQAVHHRRHPESCTLEAPLRNSLQCIINIHDITDGTSCS